MLKQTISRPAFYMRYRNSGRLPLANCGRRAFFMALRTIRICYHRSSFRLAAGWLVHLGRGSHRVFGFVCFGFTDSMMTASKFIVDAKAKYGCVSSTSSAANLVFCVYSVGCVAASCVESTPCVRVIGVQWLRDISEVRMKPFRTITSEKQFGPLLAYCKTFREYFNKM
ncbi:hypothetical protein BJ742DRAFT_820061 [Cladochytrium replicatum]|nr:hypothetical protein BJ742DRAFT_820061 [Cladochytrium replicatum]